jgi:hypothetical protein
MTRNPARLGRADSTQPEMVDWLESQEHVVQDLHTVGGGCPDLLVGTTWGELVLVECKSPGGRLTPEQRQWHWKWHHLPRCMPKSVVELRAWMENRRLRAMRR